MSKSRLTVVVAIVAAGAALTACGGSSETTAAPTPTAGATSVEQVNGRPGDGGAPGAEVGSAQDVRPAGDAASTISLEGYDRLFADPEPVGPTQTIALMFMRRLQAGDWLGAARQLSLYGRQRLSLLEPARAEAVMRDVAAKSGGARLGTCMSARRLHREAAVVRCGRVDVVVHTSTSPWRGVLISAEHPPYDVLKTPHTHAYTTVIQ